MNCLPYDQNFSDLPAEYLVSNSSDKIIKYIHTLNIKSFEKGNQILRNLRSKVFRVSIDSEIISDLMSETFENENLKLISELQIYNKSLWWTDNIN